VTTIDRRAVQISTDRIRTLTERDISALRLDWQSRVDADDARRILSLAPGCSVWLPETLEYGLVGPWRHRNDIVHIQELSAVRHPRALIEAIVERCQGSNIELVLSVEIEETRKPEFYASVDFKLVEEVVTFELNKIPRLEQGSRRLRFEPVDPNRDAERAKLIRIDHRSFPWLWINSDLEFHSYGLAPGVDLFLAYEGEQPVGYLGITSYFGWGHIDRIAVLPERQGKGYGRELLHFAIARLADRGAKRVGLSTQKANERSQHLYEKAGFRRTWNNDYRLYGRPLTAGSASGQGNDNRDE
jgi:ribosomal protein S18 acetylase RimI-like enzyme